MALLPPLLRRYHLAVRYGADIDAGDNDGRSPLHWAAYKARHMPTSTLHACLLACLPPASCQCVRLHGTV